MSNIKTTKVIIFKSNQNKFEGDQKVKSCVKGLYPTKTLKCPRVKIDKNLSYQDHVNDLCTKLSKTNPFLLKTRKKC